MMAKRMTKEKRRPRRGRGLRGRSIESGMTLPHFACTPKESRDYKRIHFTFPSATCGRQRQYTRPGWQDHFSAAALIRNSGAELPPFCASGIHRDFCRFAPESLIFLPVLAERRTNSTGRLFLPASLRPNAHRGRRASSANASESLLPRFPALTSRLRTSGFLYPSYRYHTYSTEYKALLRPR
jgi:hypothetical protein